jgi:hypothetical protein
LTEDEKQKATTFILDLAVQLDLDKAEILANLANFKTKTGHWADDSLWAAAEHCDFSCTWWEGLCVEQPLAHIALRLMKCPPSAAPCERNWSSWARIDTKPRNRTKKEKQEKLVKVMGHLQNSIPRKKNDKKECRFPSSLLEDQSDYEDVDTESDGESSEDEADTDEDSEDSSSSSEDEADADEDIEDSSSSSEDEDSDVDKNPRRKQRQVATVDDSFDSDDDLPLAFHTN